jgi:hypothetical protein
MRLSQWSAKAPFKDPVSAKVLATVGSALEALGADLDPECWVIWGDDPTVRYMLFVPTANGLVQVHVRVAVPGEGPRAAGKVVRWNRVQLGELAVEIQAGHRLVTFQVEGQSLNGADALADAISGFAQVLFAAVDGRPAPAPARAKKAAAGKTGATTRGATTGRSAAARGTTGGRAGTAARPVARVTAPKATA